MCNVLLPYQSPTVLCVRAFSGVGRAGINLFFFFRGAHRIHVAVYTEMQGGDHGLLGSEQDKQ